MVLLPELILKLKPKKNLKIIKIDSRWLQLKMYQLQWIYDFLKNNSKCEHFDEKGKAVKRLH